MRAAGTAPADADSLGNAGSRVGECPSDREAQGPFVERVRGLGRGGSVDAVDRSSIAVENYGLSGRQGSGSPVSVEHRGEPAFAGDDGPV